MRTTRLYRVVAIGLAATLASALAAACSGDDNGSNPQPTTDSGFTPDGTTAGDDSSAGNDSSQAESSTVDSPSLDTGSCKSDASTCNTCYTAAQAAADPYNACSQYTANCVPFDPTRVPSHPQI